MDVKTFENTEVAGYKAIKTVYETSFSGVTFEQLQYIIIVDKTYTFTFTDMSGEWMDTFESAAQSIYFETE